MATVGGTVSLVLVVVLFTVTAIDNAVVWFPAASRATAVNVCAPLDAFVVFHAIQYGNAVISEPRLLPSSLNWTPAIPTLSDAIAETATDEPLTLALTLGVAI